MSPPILLIHGLGSSFEHGWRRHGWIDLLAEGGRKTIAYDLPGHGLRAKLTQPSDYEDIAAKLVDELHGKAPVDLVGFSAGARIALRMAGLEPSLVRRLVVIGVGDSFLRSYDPTPLIDAIEARQPPLDYRLGTFHRLARSQGNSVEGMASFLQRRDQPFSAAMLESITAPTLVITGGRDPMGDATNLRASLRSAIHVEIGDCNHFTLPSDPEVIGVAVDFLSR